MATMPWPTIPMISCNVQSRRPPRGAGWETDPSLRNGQDDVAVVLLFG